jgi:hypothetical protein
MWFMFLTFGLREDALLRAKKKVRSRFLQMDAKRDMECAGRAVSGDGALAVSKRSATDSQSGVAVRGGLCHRTPNDPMGLHRQIAMQTALVSV